MSYETALASMFALGHELAHTPSNKFDLAHMRVLLRAMEHPERAFPSVLIAGTNGKGSTAATLASILRASGHFFRQRLQRRPSQLHQANGAGRHAANRQQVHRASRLPLL